MADVSPLSCVTINDAAEPFMQPSLHQQGDTVPRWTTMSFLIGLNIIAVVLEMLMTIAFQKYQSNEVFAAVFAGTLVLGGLAVWNIAYIFCLWSRYGFRAFYPVVVFAVAIAICGRGDDYAVQLMLVGTPGSPDSFLVGQTKADLEQAAVQTLGRSFKRVSVDPNWKSQMVLGHPQRDVPAEMTSVLGRYGFQYAEIDDTQSLVVFHHARLRTWRRYIYTANKLSPPGFREPTITEVDMEDWSELIRIANQGDHASPEEEMRMVFTPQIAYPFLQRQLGQDLLDRIKLERPQNSSSGPTILAEEQREVLRALNQHWRPANRLVEAPSITYDAANGELHIGRLRMTGFWVVDLTRKLLSEGIIVYAADNAHLRLRKELSSSDQIRIEWLHIGLMNIVYGNLFKKVGYFNARPLGDGWYYAVT